MQSHPATAVRALPQMKVIKGKRLGIALVADNFTQTLGL